MRVTYDVKEVLDRIEGRISDLQSSVDTLMNERAQRAGRSHAWGSLGRGLAAGAAVLVAFPSAVYYLGHF